MSKLDSFKQALDEYIVEELDCGCELDDEGNRILCKSCRKAKQLGRELARLPD